MLRDTCAGCGCARERLIFTAQEERDVSLQVRFNIVRYWAWSAMEEVDRRPRKPLGDIDNMTNGSSRRQLQLSSPRLVQVALDNETSTPTSSTG